MSDIVVDSEFCFDDLNVFVCEILDFDNAFVDGVLDYDVMRCMIDEFFSVVPFDVIGLDVKEDRFSWDVVRRLCLARLRSDKQSVIARRSRVPYGLFVKWLEWGDSDFHDGVVSCYCVFFMLWSTVDGFLDSFLDNARYVKAVGGDVRAMELCYRVKGDLDDSGKVTVNNVNNGIDLSESMDEIVRRINEG